MRFESRSEWREWLRQNHDKEKEVWILAYKKSTGKTTLDYKDALDEALCFGWIDSRLRRIDDEKHMWRFAPRKRGSIWSEINRRNAERLIRERRMTAAGMEKVREAKRNGRWNEAYSSRRKPRMPRDLRRALEKDAKAWENFSAFTKSCKTVYIYWVTTAKRPETRSRRIKEVVRRAARNLKPSMP